MIFGILGCFALASVSFVLGVTVATRRAPYGLPCPHAMCKNVLPRRGLWHNTSGKPGWVNEQCPVCGGTVIYNPWSGNGHELHPNDCYIRVHVPELKS